MEGRSGENLSPEIAAVLPSTGAEREVILLLIREHHLKLLPLETLRPLFPLSATRSSSLSFYSRYPIVNSLAAFFRPPIIIIDLLTLTAAKFHLHFLHTGKDLQRTFCA